MSKQTKKIISLGTKSSFLIGILFLGIFAFYCASNEPKKTIDSSKRVILFIPGYKGSELKSKGETVWLTAWQAINFTTSDLRLKDDVILEPVRSIRSITLIPYLVDFDLYGSFLNYFYAKENIQFIEFPYDWRKDNFATSQRAISFIEDLKKKNNAPITLIGHSNGGLLSLSISNQRPDLIEKVIIVGAPIRGGIGFMEDLIVGLKTGLNESISSPCVLQTFELPYAFFPGPSPSDTKDVLLNETRKPIDLNFYKASDWKKWKLGSFSSRERGCKDPLTEEDLQKRLDKALKFRLSLQRSESSKKANIPMLVISAENRSTRRNIVKSGEDWSFEKSDFVPGDGRVAKTNSLPPDDWKYEIHFTEKEHSSMLSDKKVWIKIEEFLGL